MKIYVTTDQAIAEDLMINGENEEEITQIVNEIMEKLELGILAGTRLIGDHIIADERAAADIFNMYGIKLIPVDLHSKKLA